MGCPGVIKWPDSTYHSLGMQQMSMGIGFTFRLSHKGDLGGRGALTLKVLVTTIDAQWEGMGDVGLARYDHKGFKLQ